MIADLADHRQGAFRRSRLRSSGAMAPVDAILPAPFERGMFGNDDAAVDDADQVRQLLDLNDLPGSVGHAVIIAADRYGPVMTDPPLQLQNGIEAVTGQPLQFCLLFGEGLGHPALGRVAASAIASASRSSFFWALA